MKNTAIFVFAAALLAALPSQGQNDDRKLAFGGAVLNRDLPMSTDFAKMSQQHVFGTARVMGMGGAFVSLGADLSSMSINPAGLGMYRRSEVTFSPFLSIAHSETAGTQSWKGDNKTRFALSNIGVALNVFESASSPLTSLTLGFGLNRVADFNTRYSYSSYSRYDPATGVAMPSIADIYGRQLGQAGIFPDKASDGTLAGPLGYGVDPGFWPAVLGYNGFMISPRYANPSDPDKGLVWVPDLIGHNASVLHSMDVVNSGSINEFDISMGANFNNIVYVGATIGIQSVYKKSGVVYQEEYDYLDAAGGNTPPVTGSGVPLEAQLDYSYLYQHSEINGAGMNFKLGVIVRPVAGLRLGAAFHTPTYYWLDNVYWADIETQIYKNNAESGKPSYQVNTDGTPEQRDEGVNGWEFASPSRLMFGASYTFGNFAVVSVDYERDWYNGIRVKHIPQGASISSESYKQEFRDNYQATNTIRAGVEVRPLPMLALRLGGGYTDSMFKDRSLYYNTPSVYETSYISAGVGFNLSRNTVLDLAYQRVTDKQTQYQLFFAQFVDNGEMATYSGFYDTRQTRNYISMTLGIRF